MLNILLIIVSPLSSWSTAPLDGETENLIGILRVSDNGEYAVGYDGENLYGAYYWQRATGELTFAGEYAGTKYDGDPAILNDVANNGMMVGAHRTTITKTDGTSITIWVPAYRFIDSEEWHYLPLPDEAVLSYPYDMEYNSFAYRVSPDAKVICGEMYVADPVLGKNRFEPMLWILDDEQNVVSTQTFYGLEYGNQGVEIYDMSDDGSVIVGMVTSNRGDFMPMFIQDGVLNTLDGPTLTWVADDNRWEHLDANGDEIDEEFWEGVATYIDNSGNIYYYNLDGDCNYTYYTFNVTTGERKEYDQFVTCGSYGVVVGMGQVVESPKDFDLAGIYTVLSMSDDATVFAGAGMAYTSWGDGYNYPAIVVLDESALDDGITTPDITPDAQHLMFNLAGQRIIHRQKGLTIENGKKVIK